MVKNGFPPQSLKDSERLKQLQDIMREDGYSDDDLTNDDKISEAAAKYTSNSDDIDSLMYFNAKFFKNCIKQRILPPKELYWRVRAVFVTFGDMGDADTNKPLFNDTAWKKADNILREILEGLISDPPGHSFYTYRLDKMGLRSLPNMDSGCFIVIEELMMSISTHMCRNGQLWDIQIYAFLTFSDCDEKFPLHDVTPFNQEMR